MENNSIKFGFWQARRVGGVVFGALAGLRVAFERIKESRYARIAANVILAVLLMTLWTIVSMRIANTKAQERYEEWQERYVNDFLAQREAEEIGYPPDPREELRKQEREAFAREIEGLKRFNYGYNDIYTLAQGMMCRVANPSYPNTLLEVIEQPKQWPGYSTSNQVTAANYKLAERILDELQAQEHPEVSQDFVYASFEAEGITLRDTWEISTKTHFWRYE